MWRFRLTPEDREKYGGPEWVEYSLDKAVDLPVELLEEIEVATGYTILVSLPQALLGGGLKAVRAALWLSRHIAGVHEPAFAEFKPKVLAADMEWVDPEPGTDAVPPGEPPNRAARRARTTTKSTGRRSGS